MFAKTAANMAFICASKKTDKFHFAKQSSHTTFGRFYPNLYTAWSLFGMRKAPVWVLFSAKFSLLGFGEMCGYATYGCAEMDNCTEWVVEKWLRMGYNHPTTG